jgi:crossover junction endodeoxyribonuclease RuvC
MSGQMTQKSKGKTEKIILGIDCGTAITGWSIIKYKSNGYKKSAPKLIDYGIVETHKHTPEEHRLLDLGDSISELISEFSPTELAIEDLFFFRNATTVIKVSQARGVVIYAATKAGLQYNSYTPLQIKQQLTGYGRAKKEQVIFMVSKVFGLGDKLRQDDAADAIAAGYCHYLNA